MNKKFLVVLAFCFLLCGCNPKDSSDSSSSASSVTSPIIITSSSTQQSSASTTKSKSIEEKSYSELTNSDKKRICEYIQGRYDYYDKKEGKYCGDKYSDTIWKETVNKYPKLSEEDVSIIWMKYYEY